MAKNYTSDGLIVAQDADVLKRCLEIIAAEEITDSQHIDNLALKNEELGKYLAANYNYITSNFSFEMARGFITGGTSTYSILEAAASPESLPRVRKGDIDEFNQETEASPYNPSFNDLIKSENPFLWEFIRSSSDLCGLFFGLEVSAAYDSGAVSIYRLLRLAAKNNQGVK